MPPPAAAAEEWGGPAATWDRKLDGFEVTNALEPGKCNCVAYDVIVEARGRPARAGRPRAGLLLYAGTQSWPESDAGSPAPCVWLEPSSGSSPCASSPSEPHTPHCGCCDGPGGCAGWCRTLKLPAGQ